jgi:hypothetical protein
MCVADVNVCGDGAGDGAPQVADHLKKSSTCG